MSRDAFTDIYRCLHFADDFDDDKEWSDIFFDKKHVSPGVMANHRRKFGEVEDAINRRWKECVTARKALTHDKSRIAGWYKNKITCGPEPKLIQKGANLHSLAILLGILAGYKLHARTFGGKNDGDLGMQHENCMTIQKLRGREGT
jgi:hypothetical protein